MSTGVREFSPGIEEFSPEEFDRTFRTNGSEGISGDDDRHYAILNQNKPHRLRQERSKATTGLLLWPLTFEALLFTAVCPFGVISGRTAGDTRETV